jgi:uncharacterized membrane protein
MSLIRRTAATRVGKKVAGAGLILIGIIVWAVAAALSTTAHPEVAFRGVIFGGAVAMGGIALIFAADRRVRSSRARL